MLKNGRQLLICRHYSVDDIYVIIFHVIDRPLLLLLNQTHDCSTKLTLI